VPFNQTFVYVVSLSSRESYIRVTGKEMPPREELSRRKEPVMLNEENVPNERLRRARHLKGWTQSNLAEAIGTDFETVSRWERGITLPSAYFREHLCRVLQKKPEELGFIQSLDEPLAPSSTSCLFLAAAYADAERAFTTQLKAHLLARGVAVLSSPRCADKRYSTSAKRCKRRYEALRSSC
jgi:transcriptional regulator with XRE-family HTH domain